MYHESVVVKITCDFCRSKGDTVVAKSHEEAQAKLYQLGWGVKDKKHACKGCKAKLQKDVRNVTA